MRWFSVNLFFFCNRGKALFLVGKEWKMTEVFCHAAAWYFIIFLLFFIRITDDDSIPAYGRNLLWCQWQRLHLLKQCIIIPLWLWHIWLLNHLNYITYTYDQIWYFTHTEWYVGSVVFCLKDEEQSKGLQSNLVKSCTLATAEN